jgi:excisionase family DNA binding protein
MTPDTTDDAAHDTAPVVPGASGPFYVVTITDAARLTGASVRTVQRRLDNGGYEAIERAGKRWVKLPASEINADISEKELASLAIEADTVSGDAPGDTLNAPHSTLARVVPHAATGDSAAIVAAIVAQTVREIEAQRSPSAADVAVKLLLTLPECQALTGLSRAVLRDAIESGDLKSKQIGRAWRVKRADLEAFIETL